jgi:LDH2 family malate/lactate/ureidoglycolate dehydrogenase
VHLISICGESLFLESMMSVTYFVMSEDFHDRLVVAAYTARGYTPDEGQAAARLCRMASRHGIRTHNAIKALHLDDHFGSRAGGCKPAAQIEKLPSRYKAVEKWNAHRKLGMAVAFEAMDTCMNLADEYGSGTVAVDHAFHYLWGGGYVIDAADKGYIAYTCCTAALAEVAPFQGKFPTLGTNPHSWAFPTRGVIGFPICIDWATSTVAMGRVQQLAREGKSLPPGCAVDAEGRETTDPAKVYALIPFGAHKGYGLSLINEIMAGFMGGSLPTIRNRWDQVPPGEKGTCCFYFQCIRPDAIGGDFAAGRSQAKNVKAVIDDIVGHGNDKSLLPGQIEAQAAAASDRHGGLLFTAAEIEAFKAMAAEAKFPFDSKSFKQVEA